jgi:hypothetical protein
MTKFDNSILYSKSFVQKNLKFYFYSKKLYCGSDECERIRVRKNGSVVDKKRTELKKVISVVRRSIKREESIKFINKFFKDNNYNVIDTTEYINSHNGLITVSCPNGHEWKTTLHNFKDNNNRCLYCFLKNNYTSSIEQRVRDYFEEKYPNLNRVYNDRSVIYPKELDIYFPDHKLALEICGLYWHSDTANSIDKDYHYNKMMQCYFKGVRLITVFEDEIINKFDIVISRIKQALGVVENRIYARKCSVQVVDNNTANKFFDDNHIQGSTQCKLSIGLFYSGALVACCSVGSITRNHANIGNTLELKRFCCTKDTIVVGGAGKLFSVVCGFARKNNYTNIKSYCDMRYANIFNPVYEVLGFKLLSSTKYSPHYFINNTRYRNMSLRKTPEERLTGKTELELRLEQGYNRIWDCGHRTYLMQLN